jgi:endonuclease YncB( thermonuclease family)
MNKEEFKQYGGSTPELSLNGLKTFGRIVDIYDGDTVKIILPVFGSYYKFTIRLNGIDTCEIKNKNIELKEYGIKVKNRLFELITDIKPDNLKLEIKNILDIETYIVWVECLQSDKYGRILANIYKTKEDIKSLSQILLDEKLAYKYEGKTKLSNSDIKIQLDI